MLEELAIQISKQNKGASQRQRERIQTPNVTNFGQTADQVQQ